MRALRQFFLLSIVTKVRSVNVEKAKTTEVVSHAFVESSLTADEKMTKKTVDELHTFAELKHDPRAMLPESFTICSTVVTPSSNPYKDWSAFFTIIDKDRAQFLAAIYDQRSIDSLLKMVHLQGASGQANGKIPPLFPNRWTRSCVAVNTTSGLIHWVVEGTLVLTTISEEVKSSKSRPKDLSKKLVLGAWSYSGVWRAPSGKVTNLNVYSSPLAVEKMKSMMEGEGCVEEGDYLAWRNMEWILHGQARIESVDWEEPCKGKPLADLYYTPFPRMVTCMHHCQNLGSRVPPVTNSQDWAKIQSFLKTELYDRRRNNLMLWLPIGDSKSEGEWKDSFRFCN